MNISLLGYGKMGKAVEAAIVSSGEHTVVSHFNRTSALTPDVFQSADIIIEFTTGEAFIGNLSTLVKSGKPVIVGTTGWTSVMETVKREVEGANTLLLYASNFSLGVHLFFRLVKEAAALVNTLDGFDIALSEVHHTAKADVPSGTALRAAELVIAGVGRKTKLRTGLEPNGGKTAADELLVSSLRLGKVFGEHTLHIDSESDDLTLTHRAKDRSGFAQGSLAAAVWLAEAYQRGTRGVLTIDDFLLSRLKPKS